MSEGDCERSAGNLMYHALKDLCINNANYFGKGDAEHDKSLLDSFNAIVECIQSLEPLVEELKKIAPDFDFDEQTPGNGYRSFISLSDSAVAYGVQLCRKVCVDREKILFRSKILAKEIGTYKDLVLNLVFMLKYLLRLNSSSKKGNLFLDDSPNIHELLSAAENINMRCFYGKCLGFQYCESLKGILKFINLSMAIFSEAYYSTGSLFSKATTSLWVGRKFYLDPEVRAQRIVDISMNAEVEFCQSFWCLTEHELMKQLPSIVAPTVAVNKLITIPPESFTVETGPDTVYNVTPPVSHIGPSSLNIRLISQEIHEGMDTKKVLSTFAPASPYLIFHCHGGGFVAQSSSSHEMYLRDWAATLKVPLVSVDYNLAPKAPYPRATEDVFFAYCWCLKNTKLLGWTGEKVVLAGDSAGANLCTVITLKCLETGVRLPDGVFLAYIPTLIDIVPSPARLLCFMDPLLPFGFMMRCLRAYAGSKPCKSSTGNSDDTEESFEEISVSDLVELQARKSPVSDKTDTLTNVSLQSTPDEYRSVDDEQPDDNEDEITNASKKCVCDFLDKYVLDSETESDGTKVTVLKNENDANVLTTEAADRQTLQDRLTAIIGAVSHSLNKYVKKAKSPTQAAKLLEVTREKSLMEDFNICVPKTPHLSPYYASEETLRKFPPVTILTVHLDPCLDDCVMFAKKLKKSGAKIDLRILDGLPHGFLNFSMVSKEAHDGSKICASCIGKLLGIESQG